VLASILLCVRLTHEAYAKLERPGANLQLRTIQPVEDALDAELLHMTFIPVDLVPIRMRTIRAQKHLSQADVAKSLGPPD
jgi:transcriptional regulator with XRE-family HTH domain